MFIFFSIKTGSGETLFFTGTRRSKKKMSDRGQTQGKKTGREEKKGEETTRSQHTAPKEGRKGCTNLFQGTGKSRGRKNAIFACLTVTGGSQKKKSPASVHMKPDKKKKTGVGG